MALYFITGNKGKFEEVKLFFPYIEQLNLDLPEIQEIDSYKIINTKINEAFTHHNGQFLIEDTSLSLNCLNGLPGPFIKWFLKSVGVKGISNIAEKLGNTNAEAKVIYGYAINKEDVHFFEGKLKGMIVRPRGKNGFGWDSIFKPEGMDKTYAEMNKKEKNTISHRAIALKKLKEFILHNKV